MSMLTLRPYQLNLKQDIIKAWNSGVINIAAVLPTGGGKTVIFSDIIRTLNVHTCVIAHRTEILSQIALSLACNGIEHNIIGSKSTIRTCIKIQMLELKKSFYNPNSKITVASVDTLLARVDPLRDWFFRQQLWVLDECHHLLKENKWGKVISLMKNARGLGVTATLVRSDGKGLGRRFDGLFDGIVEGVQQRELINNNYLSDYRIICPTSDLRMSEDDITAKGDYSPNKLKAAAKKSHIVGDVVNEYLRFANKLLGITFATDIETANDIANKFNTSGIPAACISSKTPALERYQLLNKFKNRELLQLVNVDLFGEGFDLPAIQVASFARPTESYGLYCQQFGRPLRPMKGKDKAIIIDHVRNVERHGLPDKKRIWTLERRDKRATKKNSNEIPLRICANPVCLSPYERTYPACPYCGFKPVPASRSAPEFVDGDLIELDEEALRKLRGEVSITNIGPDVYRNELINKHCPPKFINFHVKKFREKQEAQRILRETIAQWAGYQKALNRPRQDSYRRFYLTFGTDVLTAQTLKTNEANILNTIIKEDIKLYG